MASALVPAPAAPVASSSAAGSSWEPEPAAPAASASQFEVDLPVVSSIAERVQFYMGQPHYKAALRAAQARGLDLAGGDGVQWRVLRCQGS